MPELKDFHAGQIVSGRRAGYAEWIALGAVLAGSVGAAIGAARRARRVSNTLLATRHPDPSSVTAPHGDKLVPFWE